MSLGLNYTRSEIVLFLLYHLTHLTSKFQCFQNSSGMIIYSVKIHKTLNSQVGFTEQEAHVQMFILSIFSTCCWCSSGPITNSIYVIVIITIIILIHSLCANISCGFSKVNIRWFKLLHQLEVQWSYTDLHQLRI